MCILSDVWTREMIDSVNVGDMIEVFPDLPAAPVVRIMFRGVSVDGVHYVGLEVSHGTNGGKISTSVREGSRHWRLCACQVLSI